MIFPPQRSIYSKWALPGVEPASFDFITSKYLRSPIIFFVLLFDDMQIYFFFKYKNWLNARIVYRNKFWNLNEPQWQQISARNNALYPLEANRFKTWKPVSFKTSLRGHTTIHVIYCILNRRLQLRQLKSKCVSFFLLLILFWNQCCCSCHAHGHLDENTFTYD